MEVQEITKAQYHELWLDLNINSPSGAPSAHAAMKINGCCVKSKESPGVYPKHMGRVQHYDETANKVVIISYPEDARRPDGRYFKWEGTVQQYMSLWDCD